MGRVSAGVFMCVTKGASRIAWEHGKFLLFSMFNFSTLAPFFFFFQKGHCNSITHTFIMQYMKNSPNATTSDISHSCLSQSTAPILDKISISLRALFLFLKPTPEDKPGNPARGKSHFSALAMQHII